MTQVRGLLCAVVVALLLAGCGTIRMEGTTTVLSPNEAEQKVELNAEGLLGQALSSRTSVDDLTKDGWSANLQRTGNSVHLSLTRRGSLAQAFDMPEGTAVGTKKPDARVDVKEGLFNREYHITVTLPPSDVAAGVGAAAQQPGLNGTPGLTLPPEQMQQMRDMLKSAITFSWTIALPGKLVETNADRAATNSGTWELDLDRLQSGVEMRIVSSEGKDPTPWIAGGAGVLLVLALTFYAWFSSRRHGAHLADADDEPADPPASG